MEVTDFVDLVHAIQYKPGWVIETVLKWGVLRVVVTGRVPDAYAEPPQEFVLKVEETAHAADLAALDRPAALRWLFGLIDRLEYHEMRENFRVAGVRPYAPHTPVPDIAGTHYEGRGYFHRDAARR